MTGSRTCGVAAIRQTHRTSSTAAAAADSPTSERTPAVAEDHRLKVETTDPAKAEAERRSAVADATRDEVEARYADQKARLELRRLEAETIEAEAERDKTLIEVEEARQEYRTDAAGDQENRVYNYPFDVNANAVEAMRTTLRRWQRLDAEDGRHGREYTIVFNSPGGDVFAGWALFDELRATSNAGHPITTVCRGMAASMGGILIQAGDHRVCGPESYLMLHEVSAGAIGKVSEMADRTRLAERLTEQACAVFARRSTMSADAIYEKMKRTDWWLSADEALKLGFVDEVA